MIGRAWSGCLILLLPMKLAALDDAELSDEIERASYSIRGKDRSRPARGRFLFVLRRRSGSQTGASRSSAKPLMSFRRWGPKVLIWACATRQQSANSQSRPNGGIRISEVTQCLLSTTACDAPTWAAAHSRSIFLNRTLLSDFLPAQSARGLGLYLIDRIGRCGAR